jgi:hypothetical protein
VRNLLFWFVLAVLPVTAADQPRIVNGKLETRAAAKGLESEVRALVSASSSPLWIGYGVPMVEGRNETCSQSLSLETGNTGARDSGRVALEGERTLLVFLRAEKGQIGRGRAFSANCEVDAGGATVLFLSGGRAEESISLLSPLATGSDRHLSDFAVMAVASHAGPAADAALDKFLDPARPESLRERTTFWLGAARGRRGCERLLRLVREDPSDNVREKAVFALYVSKEPAAVDGIVGAAQNDKSPKVRGQALFWLAQKASSKAAGAIAQAIQNDPDTEVKKRAVFALSQLPKEDGVPRLIEVARTNKNPAVRKQAFFWLGQSKDARALQFFQDVLTAR